MLETNSAATITVQDTTAPEFPSSADYTVECSDEMPMDDATASDNCGGDHRGFWQTIAGDAVHYTVVRTFATDDAGNHFGRRRSLFRTQRRIHLRA